MRPNINEDYRCILCDSWISILGVLIVIVVAILYRGNLPGGGSIPNSPPDVSPTQHATVVVATEQGVGLPTALSPSSTSSVVSTLTPVTTVSPTPFPQKPTFKLVFLPMKWTGSLAQYRTVANEHAQVFVRESGIERFFDVEVVLLDENFIQADLGSDTLVADVVEFGARIQDGDRYIGITDGDIYLRGEMDVGGWTFGPNTSGVVAEEFFMISAHELGHTFGLCDEYNYKVWVAENLSFSGGCPNHYPENCDRSAADDITCEGEPTEDGRRSIMGSADYGVKYGYNTLSLNHLMEVFRELSLRASRR